MYMSEEWKVFEEEPRLLVSNMGNVKNADSGKLYYLRPDRLGYLTVRVQTDCKAKTYKVHRLVAICFIENPDDKPCVNHKDGIKYNNSLDNLEWVTHQENMQHACDTGLVIRKGSKNSRATISEETVHIICRWFENNPTKSAKDAAEIFQVSYKVLAKLRCGQNWKYIRCLYKIPPLTKRAKFID